MERVTSHAIGPTNQDAGHPLSVIQSKVTQSSTHYIVPPIQIPEQFTPDSLLLNALGIHLLLQNRDHLVIVATPSETFLDIVVGPQRHNAVPVKAKWPAAVKGELDLRPRWEIIAWRAK